MVGEGECVLQNSPTTRHGKPYQKEISRHHFYSEVTHNLTRLDQIIFLLDERALAGVTDLSDCRKLCQLLDHHKKFFESLTSTAPAGIKTHD